MNHSRIAMELRQDATVSTSNPTSEGETEPPGKISIEDMTKWEEQLEQSCKRLRKLEQSKEIDQLKKEKADLLHEAFDKIIENTITLAFQDGNGSRLVQKALQLADNDKKFEIARCFKDQVIKAMRSKHANHVLSEIIEQTNLVVGMEWFLEEIMEKPREYAKHPYGCRIFVRMVDHWLTDSQKATQHVRAKLVNFLIQKDEMSRLMKDKYGTHIIRKFWEQGIHRESVVNILDGNAFHFAQDTYGSFFVEKALQDIEGTNLGRELWNTEGAVEALSKHAGGRYVLKILETTCKYPVKEKLPEGRIPRLGNPRSKKSEQKFSANSSINNPPMHMSPMDAMPPYWNYPDAYPSSSNLASWHEPPFGPNSYWLGAQYPIDATCGMMMGYSDMPVDCSTLTWMQNQSQLQTNKGKGKW